MLQLPSYFPQALNASTSNFPYIPYHMYSHSVHRILLVISFANDKLVEIVDMPEKDVGQGHQPFIYLAEGHKVTVDWFWGHRCKNCNNCWPQSPELFCNSHTSSIYIICKQGSGSHNETWRAVGCTPMMQRNTSVERERERERET